MGSDWGMLIPADVGVVSGLRSGKKIFGPAITLDQSVSSRAWDGVIGFAGSQVISKGGSFSGATASARLRSSELHQGLAMVSAISSPTSTGRDSSWSGGMISGEITSPKFVKTVRYHGRTRKSPRSMPRFTGREVR